MHVKTGTISTQQKMCSRRVILQPFFSLCFVYSLVVFHSKQQAKHRMKTTVCVHFSLLIACQFPWLTRFSFPPCFGAFHFPIQPNRRQVPQAIQGCCKKPSGFALPGREEHATAGSPAMVFQVDLARQAS